MGRAVISLTTGLEDPEKVTVAVLVAVGAAESSRPTLIFLTKEAVRLALDGVAVGTACASCPPLSPRQGYPPGARALGRHQSPREDTVNPRFTSAVADDRRSAMLREASTAARGRRARRAARAAQREAAAGIQAASELRQRDAVDGVTGALAHDEVGSGPGQQEVLPVLPELARPRR